eukprot:243659-Pleurochrysis_carterae.AAC.1
MGARAALAWVRGRHTHGCARADWSLCVRVYACALLPKTPVVCARVSVYVCGQCVVRVRAPAPPPPPPPPAPALACERACGSFPRTLSQARRSDATRLLARLELRYEGARPIALPHSAATVATQRCQKI